MKTSTFAIHTGPQENSVAVCNKNGTVLIVLTADEAVKLARQLLNTAAEIGA